jgi:hypothetical protein
MIRAVACIGVFVLLGSDVNAYPFDPQAQELTGIRRLQWQWDVEHHQKRGRRLPPGAQLPLDKISLRMLEAQSFDITSDTPKDPQLQKGLEKALRQWRFKHYHIALLDITNPQAPLYAAIQENVVQTPGSTAKPIVALGLLQAIKNRAGKNTKKRQALLKETVVQADHWLMPNHHEVPVLKPINKGYKVSVRRVKSHDRFTLWEWLDHALSPSSNAAATMVWREAVLMNLLKENYPPLKRDKSLWSRWAREEFTEAAFQALDTPLVQAQLNVEDYYLRMFFTRGASRYIKSSASRASPLGLLRFLLRMEQGRLIDVFSSLELKRLLYLTRRRTRYVFDSSLNDSAVYFKSGSLYSCRGRSEAPCRKYEGTTINVLNGMTIVETFPARQNQAGLHTNTETGTATLISTAPEKQASAPRLVYLVALMSNELKKNAASDHARLAAQIHKLIDTRHHDTHIENTSPAKP